MSNQQQQELTSQQKSERLFIQLSQQYKTPLRNVLGEAQEFAQTTVTNMINQMVKMNLALEVSGAEIARLQKLLKDNKIDTNPNLKVELPESKIIPPPEN